MNDVRPSPEHWWDPVTLEPGQQGRWQLGELELGVRRSEQEWTLFETLLEQEPESDWSFEVLDDPPDDVDPVARHALRRTEPRIRLRPVLADRAIVTSPRVRLNVLPGEETTLYVGSPLWVRVETSEPPVTLHEVAVRRPSDTWFGPDTLVGELCYATRTKAAVQLDNLERATRRVVTAIRILNESPDSVPVEKVKLPVPFLSVFYSPSTELLWTEAVSLIQRDAEGGAELEVHGAPPDAAGDAEPLSSARERAEEGLLLRTFGRFFH